MEAFTSWGKLFHWSITLTLKKFLLMSVIAYLQARLSGSCVWRVTRWAAPPASWNQVSLLTLSRPWTILNDWMRSRTDLLSSSVKMPSLISLAVYDVALRPNTILMALSCTLSSSFLSATIQVYPAVTAYSICGLTYNWVIPYSFSHPNASPSQNLLTLSAKWEV